MVFSSSMNSMNSRLLSSTYSTYEEASLRYNDITSSNGMSSNNNPTSNDNIIISYNITDIFYNIRSILPVIQCIVQLLSMLLAPYLALLITAYSIVYILWKLNIFNDWISNEFDIISKRPYTTLLIVLITFINLFTYYIYRPCSFITGDRGMNSKGVSTTPGLYHKKLSSIEKILTKCPLITSPEARDGILKYCYHYYPSLDNKTNRKSDGNNINNILMKTFKPTPFLFSGDMMTLLPFLLFKPPDATYIRRWVRVPLASGPREKLSNNDGISSYEAVAIDYAEPVVTVESQSKTYLLIIAGLTGGSREGYVQDLVHAASTLGYGCFVMLGRGLGHENKCLSMAGFHGARTSDVEVCARLLKKSVLNKGDKLFVIGISMGGIILQNAICRGLLKIEDVDGAIAVSPCFDTIKNINFFWSRRFWQPLLAQGLKDAFASKPNDLQKLQNKLGNKRVKDVLSTIFDVFDFDSMLVPKIHDFRDVYHYYSDMSCSLLSSQIEEKDQNIKLPVPLLVLHACDDPIIHADTLPVHSNIVNTIDNLCVLVTSNGGHVGWPVGLSPMNNRWIFQNNMILEFIAAIAEKKDD